MLYIKGYHKTLQGKNFIMVFEIDGCPNLKAIEEFHSEISKNSFRVGSPLSDLPFSFLFFAKWSKGFQFLVHEFPIAVLFPTPLSTLFPSSLCCPLVHCHSAWHTCQLLFFFFFRSQRRATLRAITTATYSRIALLHAWTCLHASTGQPSIMFYLMPALVYARSFVHMCGVWSLFFFFFSFAHQGFSTMLEYMLAYLRERLWKYVCVHANTACHDKRSAPHSLMLHWWEQKCLCWLPRFVGIK